MKDSKKFKAHPFRWERYIWWVPVVWTIVIFASLLWNMIHLREMTVKIGHLEAELSLEKDMVYRNWIKRHYVVYVPVTEETPPNPYLSHIPERDITTPSGVRLTLMNPEYMTRQIYKLTEKEYTAYIRTTSLNPISPENSPDPWEAKALKNIEQGKKEVRSVEKIEQKDHFRLIRPLITDGECLKCHAKDGYKEGDIRGGISVAVSMEPLWAIERSQKKMYALVHFLIWLVGLTGIGMGMQKIRRHDQVRREAEESLQEAYAEVEQKVEERTAELRAVNESLQKEIVERKRIEDEATKLQNAVHQVADILFITDRNGIIEYVNPAFEKITGYCREEAIGNRPNILKSGLMGPEYYSNVWSTILSGNVYRAEVVNKKKNGELFYYDQVITPLKDSQGNITHFISVGRDITPLKKKEEEMGALQEQLRQSQKVEAIGQLAGGIAHDFNNLLTIIKGYSHLSLLELKEGDPLRANIDEINKASERAANLTRQILAFSRRQPMEMQVLDLNQVLKNLDKMLRRMIGEDIELATLLSEDLGGVMSDPGQIEQVIMNLAVNARDAMPGGGKLTIETANVELDEEYARSHIAVTPGRYVLLSVSDTGVGMRPEIKERVFEPFFTTKEKGRGTGLGLSTVYGIVKQSGGNIWVYSEPAQGTTFKIYLPRVDEPAEELRKKIEGAELPRGSETILLVEDDEKVRELAVKILEMQGYEVLEAGSGSEALRICQEFKKPIHLILTDVVMPEMSGRQLAERLREVCEGFKVLYMSGYTDNAIVHHGVLEKGVDFIQKPFTMDGLARKVREVLDSPQKIKK